MKLLSAMLLSLGLSFSVWAEDDSPTAYLCIIEHSAGVKMNMTTKSWEPTVFNFHPKYIFKSVSNESEESSLWTVRDFRHSNLVADCTSPDERGQMYSDGIMQVWFNIKTLRFQTHYFFGYMTADKLDESGNAPRVSIGTCSPL